MPTYLDMLPEDTLTHIYRLLYKSIIIDMKKDYKYINLKCFNQLIELSKDPYIDNLNYTDFLVSSCIDKIVDKYINCKLNYDGNKFYNTLKFNISLFYKSYYIKPLEIDINKIEIFNFYIHDLFKDNDEGIELFNQTYFMTTYYTGIIKGINRNGFVFEKEKSFRCLAEILYHIIEFYDFVKQIVYMNINMLEQIGMVLNLSTTKMKELDNLIDILNYHLNNRYLEGLVYDIEYKCAKPLLK